MQFNSSDSEKSFNYVIFINVFQAFSSLFMQSRGVGEGVKIGEYRTCSSYRLGVTEISDLVFFRASKLKIFHFYKLWYFSGYRIRQKPSFSALFFYFCFCVFLWSTKSSVSHTPFLKGLPLSFQVCVSHTRKCCLFANKTEK